MKNLERIQLIIKLLQRLVQYVNLRYKPKSQKNTSIIWSICYARRINCNYIQF